MNPIVPIGIAAGIGGLLYLRSQKKTGLGPMASGPTGSPYKQAAWATGMSVSDVQRALNQLGAEPPLAEDGQAGPKTQAAIRSFQAQSGIHVDGVVGPETTAALEHALAGSHQAVAGWFLEDEPDDECMFYEEEEELPGDVIVTGQTTTEAIVRRGGGRGGLAWRGATAIEEPHVVGAEWSAPSVAEITGDPRQMEAIGLQQLWAKKAEEAFGPGTAYRYSSPLTAQDLASAEALAASELEGEHIGGTYLAGEFEEEEYGEEIAVSGWGDVDDGSGWSAPDIAEAYADPEQVAEMAMHAMPYGFPLPYAAMPSQPPMFAPPGTYPYGYGAMPVNAPIQPPGTYPAAYPYGPMNMPTLAAPSPATIVPGRGYEFQSQAGRNF